VKEGKYGGCIMYTCIQIHIEIVVEIVPRKERERRCGRMMKGMNQIKVYCEHICNCHNESPPVGVMHANKQPKKMRKCHLSSSKDEGVHGHQHLWYHWFLFCLFVVGLQCWGLNPGLEPAKQLFYH
jgi:hypothetical protein